MNLGFSLYSYRWSQFKVFIDMCIYMGHYTHIYFLPLSIPVADSFWYLAKLIQCLRFKNKIKLKKKDWRVETRFRNKNTIQCKEILNSFISIITSLQNIFTDPASFLLRVWANNMGKSSGFQSLICCLITPILSELVLHITQNDWAEWFPRSVSFLGISDNSHFKKI